MINLRKLCKKVWESDKFFWLYQLSKPLLAFLFLAGVLYLDKSLNEAGCRFLLQNKEIVLQNITNGA